MKRCPQCGREYDTSMMFCLDDGAELLYGPASEPGAIATGFLSEQPASAIRKKDWNFERSFKERSDFVIESLHNPIMDPLPDHPRVQEILSTVTI